MSVFGQNSGSRVYRVDLNVGYDYQVQRYSSR